MQELEKLRRGAQARSAQAKGAQDRMDEMIGTLVSLMKWMARMTLVTMIK